MTSAVVTGAASGNCRALATQLAAEGHEVHLADLAPTADLAADLGGIPHAVDVSRPEDVMRLARQAPDADVVCLNAGIVGSSMGAPWEAPPEEWQHLLDVNLLGVVHGLRAFVPHLIGLPGPGRLLITASLAGLLTFPFGGAYAATKHALIAVAEQAALALRETSVTVTLCARHWCAAACHPTAPTPERCGRGARGRTSRTVLGLPRGMGKCHPQPDRAVAVRQPDRAPGLPQLRTVRENLHVLGACRTSSHLRGCPTSPHPRPRPTATPGRRRWWAMWIGEDQKLRSSGSHR